jgi:anaerobic magnesium-protoporphyrin IX monomethyl ester cyclase
MKKILLINPPETEQDGFTNPPIGLLYLAGTLIPNGYSVKVVDGCIEGKESVREAIATFQPDLVGVTCLTPGRKKAIYVAMLVKDLAPSTTVVFGGAHATIMHRQLLEHYPCIDYIVLGEGESTFLDIAQGKDPSLIPGIAYRKQGKAVCTEPRKNKENLDEIPFPAWHLVDLQKYPSRGKGSFNGIDLAKEPRISVIYSRGCVGHCDFCSTWWIWKGWRHRSPVNMVNELELLYRDNGIRHFWFADDALTINREATIGLCDEIVRRGLKIAFFATTRTDHVDETVLRKLKDAGCYGISYGVETGSPLMLERMGKENDIETSEKAIQLTKQVGLQVTALMIVGNIGETDETINDTVQFLRRTRPDEIGCAGGLWIFPGTKVFHHAKKQGFISDDFWLTDAPYKVYTLEHSEKQLKHYFNRVMNYSFTSRMRRMAEFLTSIPQGIRYRAKKILGVW